MVRPFQQQHGAVEARGAHNPEVTRSKRVVAKIFVPCLMEYAIPSEQENLGHHSDMAQWKRVGLMTPRSLDRNELLLAVNFFNTPLWNFASSYDWTAAA